MFPVDDRTVYVRLLSLPVRKCSKTRDEPSTLAKGHRTRPAPRRHHVAEDDERQRMPSEWSQRIAIVPDMVSSPFLQNDVRQYAKQHEAGLCVRQSYFVPEQIK